MSVRTFNLNYADKTTDSILKDYFSSTPDVQDVYRMNVDRFKSPLPPSIDPVISDLLHIAAIVMCADRTCRRSRDRGDVSFYPERGWVRQFELTISVNRPDIWTTSSVMTALVDVLHWLTEDEWVFHFVESEEKIEQKSMSQFIPSPPTDTPIVLFSGGLDSLAGVVELLQTEDSVLLLSIVASRLQRVLKNQVGKLQRFFGHERVKDAPMPFNLVYADRMVPANKKRSLLEDTQRSRGFLYFAMAVAQATIYNSQRIIVCENGIGMLNLPFNQRSLGTQLTRSVHPYTIYLLIRLLDSLPLAHKIRYEAPFLGKTKGELCTSLVRDPKLSLLCNLTSSCDSFPINKKIPPLGAEHHCGTCTSCLLRRQAIFVAGLQKADAKVQYAHDSFHYGLPEDESKREGFLMMYDQATMLQHIFSEPDPTSALFCTFPELYRAQHAVAQLPTNFRLAPDQHPETLFTRLLDTYSNEWQEISQSLPILLSPAS